MKTISLLLIAFSTMFSDLIRDDQYSFIIDTETSLMWEDVESRKGNWSIAINRCSGLSVAGYDDWFLPNFNQLFSISDDTKSSPAMSTSFSIRVSDHYWSSTTLHNETSKAWSVDFSSGEDSYQLKTLELYYRCVRILK